MSYVVVIHFVKFGSIFFCWHKKCLGNAYIFILGSFLRNLLGNFIMLFLFLGFGLLIPYAKHYGTGDFMF